MLLLRKKKLTIARLLAVAVKALLFFFPVQNMEPEYSELIERNWGIVHSFATKITFSLEKKWH